MPSSERLASLREMLADDPEDPFLRYGVAMELKGLDRISAALAEFKALLERSPDYVPSYYHYAALLEKVGESEEACGIIRRGLSVAQQAGDDHAQNELEDLLDAISP